MRFSILAGLLAIASTGSAGPCNRRGVCNADNCARLVTGTRAGLPSTRLADCSSFLAATTSTVSTTVTVTPVVTQVSVITTNPVYVDVTTVTVTTVPISRSSGAAVVSARAVGPITGTVPAYATSACPAPSRYSSACSCAGVTAGSASTTTTTLTVTGQPVTTEVYTAATTTVERTATVTQTAAAKTGYQCGTNVQGNGIYSFRSYSVHCGQRVTSGQVAFSGNYAQESECLRVCNSIKYCVYAEYAFSSGECNLYYSSPTAIVDDSDRDALILR